MHVHYYAYIRNCKYYVKVQYANNSSTLYSCDLFKTLKNIISTWNILNETFSCILVNYSEEVKESFNTDEIIFLTEQMRSRKGIIHIKDYLDNCYMNKHKKYITSSHSLLDLNPVCIIDGTQITDFLLMNNL